jgi:beta-lactamase class D
MRVKIFLGSLLLLLTAACGLLDRSPLQRLDEQAIDAIFAARQVEGCLVLYDMKRDQWLSYRPERVEQRFIPASTYKIPHTLIALETGALRDSNEVIPWDSVPRFVPAWNRDHRLRTAFYHSVVPFYQEVARRVGRDRMQYWLERLAYGNQTPDGEIDSFWLNGGLRISAREQIEFLRRLYHNELPCTQETLDILKDIFIREQTNQYVLRAKSGWASEVEPQIGWYVGWLERGEEVILFAENLDIRKAEDRQAREEIIRTVFRQTGLMPADDQAVR